MRNLKTGREAWDRYRRGVLVNLYSQYLEQEFHLRHCITQSNCRKERTDLYAQIRSLHPQYLSTRRRFLEVCTLSYVRKLPYRTQKQRKPRTLRTGTVRQQTRCP